jgi:hypothetical protein
MSEEFDVFKLKYQEQLKKSRKAKKVLKTIQGDGLRVATVKSIKNMFVKHKGIESYVVTNHGQKEGNEDIFYFVIHADRMDYIERRGQGKYIIQYFYDTDKCLLNKRDADLIVKNSFFERVGEICEGMKTDQFFVGEKRNKRGRFFL